VRVPDGTRLYALRAPNPQAVSALRVTIRRAIAPLRFASREHTAVALGPALTRSCGCAATRASRRRLLDGAFASQARLLAALLKAGAAEAARRISPLSLSR